MTNEELIDAFAAGWRDGGLLTTDNIEYLIALARDAGKLADGLVKMAREQAELIDRIAKLEAVIGQLQSR